ncbi:MAG: hypothetical protein FH748_04425 [Balneolaceae bacterium]|nr:hypothetical protein [Balneolaceae bacterium]
MISKIKNIENLKLYVSIFVFALSGLFFINSTPPPPVESYCKSCGSWDDCYDGNTNLQNGWENCRHVPGMPPCEVYGEYGSCSGPGTPE